MRQGGIEAGETTRLLSLDIELETHNKSKTTKHKVKQRNLKTITLISSYHLHMECKDREAKNHNEMLANMVSKISRDNPIIIGADITASIGTREDGEEKEEEINILGPHGNKRKDNRGEMILNTMRKTDL